jgi:hypothetical protein
VAPGRVYGALCSISEPFSALYLCLCLCRSAEQLKLEAQAIEIRSWRQRFAKLHAANLLLRAQLGLPKYASTDEEFENESDDDDPTTTTTTTTTDSCPEPELAYCAMPYMASATTKPQASLSARPYDRGDTIHAPPLGPLPQPAPACSTAPAGATMPTFGFLACDCISQHNCSGCVINGALFSILTEEHACASNPNPGGGGFADDDPERLTVRTVPLRATPLLLCTAAAAEAQQQQHSSSSGTGFYKRTVSLRLRRVSQNKEQRYRCYRAGARALGYTYRRPLPNCFVWAVRVIWPEASGIYTGYRP